MDTSDRGKANPSHSACVEHDDEVPKLDVGTKGDENASGEALCLLPSTESVHPHVVVVDQKASVETDNGRISTADDGKPLENIDESSDERRGRCSSAASSIVRSSGVYSTASGSGGSTPAKQEEEEKATGVSEETTETSAAPQATPLSSDRHDNGSSSAATDSVAHHEQTLPANNGAERDAPHHHRNAGGGPPHHRQSVVVISTDDAFFNCGGRIVGRTRSGGGSGGGGGGRSSSSGSGNMARQSRIAGATRYRRGSESSGGSGSNSNSSRSRPNRSYLAHHNPNSSDIVVVSTPRRRGTRSRSERSTLLLRGSVAAAACGSGGSSVGGGGLLGAFVVGGGGREGGIGRAGRTASNLSNGGGGGVGGYNGGVYNYSTLTHDGDGAFTSYSNMTRQQSSRQTATAATNHGGGGRKDERLAPEGLGEDRNSITFASRCLSSRFNPITIVCELFADLRTFMRELIDGYGGKFIAMLAIVYFAMKGLSNNATSAAMLPFYKKSLKIPSTEYQKYFNVANMAFSLKPLIGLLSDLMPLGGYSKRYYVALISIISSGSLFTISLWASKEVASTTAGPLSAALFFLFFVGIAGTDLLMEGKYSEYMNIYKAPSSVITFVWLCFSVGALGGALLEGPMADVTKAEVILMVAAPFAAIPAIFALLGWIPEKKRRRIKGVPTKATNTTSLWSRICCCFGGKGDGGEGDDGDYISYSEFSPTLLLRKDDTEGNADDNGGVSSSARASAARKSTAASRKSRAATATTQTSGRERPAAVDKSSSGATTRESKVVHVGGAPPPPYEGYGGVGSTATMTSTEGGIEIIDGSLEPMLPPPTARGGELLSSSFTIIDVEGVRRKRDEKEQREGKEKVILSSVLVDGGGGNNNNNDENTTTATTGTAAIITNNEMIRGEGVDDGAHFKGASGIDTADRAYNKNKNNNNNNTTSSTLGMGEGDSPYGVVDGVAIGEEGEDGEDEDREEEGEEEGPVGWANDTDGPLLRALRSPKGLAGLGAITALCSLAMAIISLLSTSNVLLSFIAPTASLLLVASFMILPRAAALANLFMFLRELFYLQMTGPLDYFYTATPACLPDGPHFTYSYYQTLVSFLGAGGTMAGTIIFQRFLSKMTFMRVFWVSTSLKILASGFDLIITKRWNIHYLGISDELMFLCGDAIIYPICTMLDFMPTTVLLSRLCPHGMESTMFALLASFNNFGASISRAIGYIIAEKIGIQTDEDKGCDFSNLWLLVVLGHMLMPTTIYFNSWALMPDTPMSTPLDDEEEDDTEDEKKEGSATEFTEKETDNVAAAPEGDDAFGGGMRSAAAGECRREKDDGDRPSSTVIAHSYNSRRKQASATASPPRPFSYSSSSPTLAASSKKDRKSRLFEDAPSIGVGFATRSGGFVASYRQSSRGFGGVGVSSPVKASSPTASSPPIFPKPKKKSLVKNTEQHTCQVSTEVEHDGGSGKNIMKMDDTEEEITSRRRGEGEEYPSYATGERPTVAMREGSDSRVPADGQQPLRRSSLTLAHHGGSVGCLSDSDDETTKNGAV